MGEGRGWKQNVRTGGFNGLTYIVFIFRLLTHIKDDLRHCTKIYFGASLVAQWLRICLPMQGTRVRALVWEDPTCCGATGPVSHNY